MNHAQHFANLRCFLEVHPTARTPLITSHARRAVSRAWIALDTIRSVGIRRALAHRIDEVERAYGIQ